jgi:hypothetical protein
MYAYSFVKSLAKKRCFNNASLGIKEAQPFFSAEGLFARFASHSLQCQSHPLWVLIEEITQTFVRKLFVLRITLKS